MPIAKANADQDAAEAEQQSKRAQADFARQTAIVRANAKAEVDAAESQAAQAGPLAQADAEKTRRPSRHVGCVAVPTSLAPMPSPAHHQVRSRSALHTRQP